MKFEKVNDTPMRNIVGRAFIRVVKNHNLYNVFVNSFKRLKGQRMGERNPFGELQDFQTRFYCVSDICRREKFEKEKSKAAFSAINNRVKFLTYEQVENDYEKAIKQNFITY